jgi:glycosyltransferase involved in cell wall biosynthesis
MKNILIIHSSLDGGGAERVLVEYLNNFDYNNFKITLILIWKSCKEHFLAAIPKQVELIFVSEEKQLNKIERVLYRLGMHSLIEKIQLNRLRLGNYDVIISFMEGLALKYHCHLLNKSARNITWVHIDLNKNHWSQNFFINRRHECNVYNKMTDIVFVSEVAKSAFNNIFEINQKINQKVVYNPIDKHRILNKSTIFDVKKIKYTIIGVGRLDNQKRFDRFIEVAKILIDKKYDIEFWILGAGNLEKELKEKTKKLGLSKNIIFKGFIDNPYPYIKSADIFLLTSDTEGYPTVICESLVLGKPVVMTEVPGAKELLGDSEYGIITKNMSPEILAEEVEKLYLDKILYNSFMKKSIQRSEIFQLDKTMNEIYQIINFR